MAIPIHFQDTTNYQDVTTKLTLRELIYRFTWCSGPFCMIVSTLIFTGMSVGVKLVCKSIPVFEVLFARGICGAIITALLARAVGVKSLFGQPRRAHLMLMRSLFGTIAMGMSYFALVLLPLGDFTALFISNPVFNALIAWVLLEERITGLSVLGILLALLGIPVVYKPPFLFGHGLLEDKDRLYGICLAIGAAILASAAFTAVRLIKDEASLSITMWYHTTSTILAAIPLAFKLPWFPKVPNPYELMWLLIIVVLSFMGQIFLTRGFQLLPDGKASAINMLQVVEAFFYDWVIWHIIPDPFSVGGAVLVGAGVILVHISKEQLKRRTSDYQRLSLSAMLLDDSDLDDESETLISRKGSFDGM